VVGEAHVPGNSSHTFNRSLRNFTRELRASVVVYSTTHCSGGFIAQFSKVIYVQPAREDTLRVRLVPDHNRGSGFLLQ
jgi:hypothetical protein